MVCHNCGRCDVCVVAAKLTLARGVAATIPYLERRFVELSCQAAEKAVAKYDRKYPTRPKR